MKRKLPILIHYTILIIYSELIYKALILNNILSINTLTIILFSIPFILLFTILSSIFKSKINKILTIIYTILITLIYSSQYIYYEFYNSIFSVYSVKLGTGQVFGEFSSAIIKMILDNIWGLILLLLPLIIYLIFNKRIYNFYRYKLNLIIYTISFIIFNIIIFLVIKLNNIGMYSINRLFTESHAPMITINKVGLLPMEVLDIERFIFGFKEKLDIDENIIINNNNTPIIEETPIIEYNTLDIDFDNLINNTSNSTIKKLHTYFKNNNITNKNEYTGIFKDKNLIYITAEAFDTIAVDKDLTPTLYKLVNNGFVFENYYQPLYSVSTSDGEYMFMNSLIPKEGVWSFYRSSNIYMPFALGNMFKNIGYNTYAYHNHTYKYYNRNLSHPNLGFNVYKGCGNGLEKLINCKTWPESDIEMIDATIPDYIDNDKFLSYYMTVSGHLNYTFSGNYISNKNKNLVKDLPYSDHVKAYLSANIELDRALEHLLTKLEEKNILDDTVIVLSPDHYPYGLKTEELNEISKTDRSDKFEMFHTSLILYNSEITTPIKVTKYVSSIDVLPTVYNLFGINYDSRLLMGTDALSTSSGLVMLSDRSWINEYGKYNSITGKFENFTKDLPNDYVKNINSIVYAKFTTSSLLLYEEDGIYLDYYKTLGV